MRPLVLLIALVGCSSSSTTSSLPQPRNSERAASGLLAADRAFSASSARTDLISGITAMLAPDVVMPLPGGKFANGVTAVRDALAANQDNATATATWTPVRAGISGDGQHGFTYGFMTVTNADRSITQAKYLAYWVRQNDEWRVTAYKRTPRPDGEVSLELLPPSLPLRTTKPSVDQALLLRNGMSLSAAEQGFSNDAQTMGLGAAFMKYGAPDAMNMGSDAAFLSGPEDISRSVGGNTPSATSPVSWRSDKVLVASSGDLGVSIGVIWRNAPPPQGEISLRFAFFTVWRRATPNDPWRYVAE